MLRQQRVTRSGGPPQSAAVVNPTRKSSKKKARRAAGMRQATGTSQRQSSSGTSADATEGPREQFLHLSRLAKELRDAAADHPLAHGPLLDFLSEHWVLWGGPGPGHFRAAEAPSPLT